MSDMGDKPEENINENENTSKVSEAKEKIQKRVLKKTLNWDKLDNTAILFPVIASRNMTNVYRISVTLTEDVDRIILQKALDKVLPQIEMFKMRLRAGFFWYYFEENTRPAPIVMQEYDYPGAYIDKRKNNHYMFRVTYYGKRINLEVFHALSDGYGGIIFLTELLYQYLRIAHPELLEVDKDKISSGIFLDKEDSYVKNFKKQEGKTEKGYKSKKAVTIKGEMLNKGEIGLVHGYFPVEQLKVAAKKYGVTINQYLVGAFVYAIYREYLKGSISKNPISCCVPVNLRPYYDSHTMKNFFAMVSADFKPIAENYEFEEVLNIVADSLKRQITPANLNKILTYNVSNEQIFLLRLVPLVLKSIALKHVYSASTGATSSTMTNIGNIELKEPYRKYVKHFYAMISMSKDQNIKGGICSYNGILTVTFTSVLRDLNIQKRFFQVIAADGVDVAVETNDAYYE